MAEQKVKIPTAGALLQRLKKGASDRLTNPSSSIKLQKDQKFLTDFSRACDEFTKALTDSISQTIEYVEARGRDRDLRDNGKGFYEIKVYERYKKRYCVTPENAEGRFNFSSLLYGFYVQHKGRFDESSFKRAGIIKPINRVKALMSERGLGLEDITGDRFENPHKFFVILIPKDAVASEESEEEQEPVENVPPSYSQILRRAPAPVTTTSATAPTSPSPSHSPQDPPSPASSLGTSKFKVADLTASTTITSV
jgi:hypothetical protein